jgi:hypothetical protein
MACGESATRVERAVTSMLDGRAAAGFSGPDLSLAKQDQGQLVFAAG